MSLLPYMPSGGSSYPGFSTLTGKALEIYHPLNPTTPLYTVTDDDFRDGFEVGGATVPISVPRLSVNYLEGKTLTIQVIEDWTSPFIPLNATIKFYANIPETWTQGGSLGWTKNEGSTGQSLIFAGRVSAVAQTGVEGEGYGAVYTCRGLLYYANMVSVVTAIPDKDGIQIPRRYYNVDGTDNRSLWRQSIKKNSSFLSGGMYNYAPYGDTGIRSANTTHASGMPQNLNDNQKMTVGEIIKDLFGSHGEPLKKEGVIPSDWNPETDDGTTPYVQAELDLLDIVPGETGFSGSTSFIEAIRQIIKTTYPNYAVWVTDAGIWHFTPILDNLKETANDEEHVLDPAQWKSTRLPTVAVKLAEPEPADDATGRAAGEIIYGRLIRAGISQGTDDRYTAVRITGSETVETSEASTQKGNLTPAWGGGNAAAQAALQSGYVAGGPEASTHRHYDRGDNNLGIPIYKAVAIDTANSELYFKGYQSELWPHTNYEWNGTSCLLAPAGLGSLSSGTYSWFETAERYSILESWNVDDVGDGTPGYKIKVFGLNVATLRTILTHDAYQAARIQLTDDFGIPTTINPNQLSLTFREFQIEESSRTYGSQYNNNAETPCNARVIVNGGPLSPVPPDGVKTGAPPGDLLEYGQALGNTHVSALGRIHMNANNGNFWFGNKLIIPFAAIKQGRARFEANAFETAKEEFCKRGRATIAPDIQVVYEKSTQEFREVRAPATGYSGTAAIWAGIERELRIHDNRFVSASQAGNFQSIAEAILATTSDLQPKGDGWEFIEAPRFLSLVDLHIRLDVDLYREFGVGVGSPYDLKQGVVTGLDFDFANDTVTVEYDSDLNPIGDYGHTSLLDVLTNQKLLKEAEEERQKEARETACRNSYQLPIPVSNDIIHPICDRQVVRSSGPQRGKSKPPVDCHVLGGFPLTADGIVTATPSGSGGGAASDPSSVNVTSGTGAYFHPFLDERGRLFFYDLFGSFFRGDETALIEGASEHSNVFLGSGDARNQSIPDYRFEEQNQVTHRLLSNLFGAVGASPEKTSYNVVESYDEDTGIITLVRNNLTVDAYINGRAVISDGPNAMPVLYIDDNTADTVTLRDPGSGYPSESLIPAGTHIFVVAQRKPYPSGSGLSEDDYVFKDSNGDWFTLSEDGTTTKAQIVSGTENDFRPELEAHGTPADPVWSFGFSTLGANTAVTEVTSAWNNETNHLAAHFHLDTTPVDHKGYSVVEADGVSDTEIFDRPFTVPAWYQANSVTVQFQIELHFILSAAASAAFIIKVTVAPYSNGDTLPLTEDSIGVEVDVSSYAASDLIIETLDVELPSTTLTPGDEVVITLERPAVTDSGDTYTGTVFLYRAKIKSASTA